MNEEGISYTDALMFYGIVLNISGQINNEPEHMIRNLEVLIKIPHKKKTKLKNGIFNNSNYIRKSPAWEK